MSENITLVGNIVGDPEQRTTRAGEVIAAFRLAASDRRYDRERSQWVDGHTNYYAVSVFGELGRHALSSLHKGERIIVAGRLTLREWETDAKRGLSADVTAVAVGHDLRWGVSRFERERRPDAPPSGGVEGGGDTRGGEWAVPGAPGPAPELAAASGVSGDPAPTDAGLDDTPF